MARTKTVEIHIPANVYDEYRDYLIDELSAREFKDRRAGANTYAGNGAVGEALLADCILSHIAEVLYDAGDRPVSPTPEGGLEIGEKPRNDDGTFQSEW